MRALDLIVMVVVTAVFTFFLVKAWKVFTRDEWPDQWG